MPDYMLLLHESPATFKGLSPQDMQLIIQKYDQWAEKLTNEERLVGGKKLTDDRGHVMQKKNGDIRILDGPFSETKEVIGGYFSIRADSYSHACDIARECPHLGYGGRIEIRQIDDAG